MWKIKSITFVTGWKRKRLKLGGGEVLKVSLS